MVTLVLGHQDQLTNAVKHHLRETHRKTHTVRTKAATEASFVDAVQSGACRLPAASSLFIFFLNLCRVCLQFSSQQTLLCVFRPTCQPIKLCNPRSTMCSQDLGRLHADPPPTNNVHGQTHLKPACPPAVPLKFSRGASIGSVPTDSHSFPAELTMFNKI